MWDSYWPYWEFSVETKGELCLRGINLFPYMGTEKKKKEDYPCQYFKFAVTRDWMSQGNRKEIQSLSLLGHWLKSCLFQQWPKLITIQACCSVTNSMWKELVASEAGAHCRQPQQKDQGFGWTLNLNFSSAPDITPCPNHIPGVPVLQTALCMLGLTMDLAHHLASAWPPLEGTCAATMGSALQPGWGGTVSCHRGPCPPCSDPRSPPPFCSLARPLLGQRGRRGVSAGVTTPISTPGTLLSRMFPGQGTEN